MIIALVNTDLHMVHSLSPQNTVMFVTNAIFMTENVNIKYTLFGVACNLRREPRQIIPGLPTWTGLNASTVLSPLAVHPTYMNRWWETSEIIWVTTQCRYILNFLDDMLKRKQCSIQWPTLQIHTSSHNYKTGPLRWQLSDAKFAFCKATYQWNEVWGPEQCH